MADRDGVFVEDDFLGGAGEAPMPQPRPLAPTSEILGIERVDKLLPYDKNTNVISSYRALTVKQLVDGKLETRHFEETTGYCGADGAVIDKQKVRMCPVSGHVYSGESERCFVCHRLIFPAEMVATLLDQSQRVCVGCAETHGL
jgi:hypothetical protein